VRADAFVPRDLLGGEAARDEPQDLHLPIGDREVAARTVQEDAARNGPSDHATDREP
jgi:hypothetical protein